MTEREHQKALSHSHESWTRRALASLMIGVGFTSAIEEVVEGKKKKKGKGKKKKKPTPSGTCAPACGSRTCGDDGCGGSCGTCGSGTVCAAGQCVALNGYEFEREWGSWGSAGPSKFNAPWGIAVDGDSNVYVADADNDRVQKFSGSGQYITEWGGVGTIDGKFNGPAGIDVGPAGQVYVADSLNNRIQRFTDSGGHIQSWGTMGLDPGEFMTPQGVAINPINGTVYVVDGDNRIQIFDGSVGVQTIRLTFEGNAINGRAVTVGSDGRILYVNRNLGYIFSIDPGSGVVSALGGPGTGNAQFKDPSDVATDSAGNIFIADRGNHRVQVLRANGDFVTAFGREGSGAGQFRNPIGIDVDAPGNVYVTDLSNNRVQKFRPAAARRDRA